MAMEVEAYMPEQYLRPSYKGFNHERTHRTFEIRVIYVRIISSKCMGCKMEIAFPPTRDPKTRFQVNGAEIGENRVHGFSMALNKNRVDTVMGESTYVSTNTIGFCGSLLCFEIMVKGLLCPLAVGVVRRRDGCMWVMECKEGSLVVPDGGILVDVYFAGSSNGKPLLLNGLMDLRKDSLSCIPESDHDPQEMEEKCLGEEQGNGAGLRDLCSKGEMEMEMDGEEEDEECEGDLAWFKAGVGVGVSLGLGIGLGLLFRTYQAAAGILRRFI
ncbi:hypothetical protein J5N97_009256 [Dioscorea zingiberensis]|uniref:Uncharacterized protein n=1 Tax=Dioscorea zingiberensis TaxID=325984 RepID=A0A9D5HLT2_9LILI|nr:hypothetical protein J5N97_009256 [Dioscorea zingiberensis]